VAMGRNVNEIKTKNIGHLNLKTYKYWAPLLFKMSIYS